MLKETGYSSSHNQERRLNCMRDCIKKYGNDKFIEYCMSIGTIEEQILDDFILLMTELEITCGDIKNLLKLKRNHGYYSNMQQKYDNARLLNEIYCLKEQQKELDKKINFLIAHEKLLKNENIVLKKHINNTSIQLHKLFTMNYSIIETSCHRKKRNFNEI